MGLYLDLSLISFSRGRFWTVLTSLLWEPPRSVLSTLFALLLAFWVLNGAPTLERANGSGRLLVWTAAASVAVNVTFLILAQALHMVWQALGWMSIWPLVQCHGIMPLGVFAMTARCSAAPDIETQFFGLRMKNKYYPLVLVGLFGLLSGPAVLQDVAGLIVGYFHERPLRLRSLLPAEATVTNWESGRGCIFGRSFFGGQWVRIADSFGGSGLEGGFSGLPTSQGYTMLGRPQARRQSREMPAGTQFQVFGGRGQRLGS